MSDLVVLVVTAMYPTAGDPVKGIAVQREVEALRSRGCRVEVVGKAAGWKEYARQALEVRRAYRRIRPSVVHAHYGTSGLVAAVAAPLTPLVLTLHGSDIAHGARPSFSKYWIQYFLSVVAIWRSASIIVQHESMLRQVPRVFRHRATILGQAVDMRKFGGPRTSTSTAPPSVLFLSDPARAVKRFDLASSVVSSLNYPVNFVSLADFAPHDIPTAMLACDVGLLTSDREGMPVAVKEALVAGLPVVSVPLPSLTRLAREVQGLLHLVSRDPEELAMRLDAVIKRPPVGESGRIVAIEALRRMKALEPERTEALMALYSTTANSH